MCTANAVNKAFHDHMCMLYISGSLYRWTDACVLLLLDNYKAAEHKFSDGKQSQKDMGRDRKTNDCKRI